MHKIVMGALALTANSIVSPALATAGTAGSSVVRITGYAASKYIREPLTEQADWMMVRTGAPTDDLSTWLPSTDRAYALLRKEPKMFATAEVAINFDEKGLPETCSVMKAEGQSILTDGLCDRILPRARLVPPLTRGGEKQSDTLKLTITFNPAAGNVSRVPVIPPVIFYPGQTLTWTPNLTRTEGLNLFRGDIAHLSEGTPGIILVVNAQGGRAIGCRVIEVIGVPNLGDQACQRASQATYKDAKSGRDSGLFPILFVGNDLKAVLPTRESGEQPLYIDAESAKLATAAARAGGNLKSVEAEVQVGSDGRPTDCWLSHGSGSDRADLAICDQMLKDSAFEPGTDIFGRPIAERVYDLELGKQTSETKRH